MIIFFEYICMIFIGIGLYNLIEQLPKNEMEDSTGTSYKALKVTGGVGLVIIPSGLLFFLLNL
jgi:hypothetical protein